MEQIIVWEKAGKVMLTTPGPGVELEKAIRLTVPEGTPYTIVDRDSVPKDRTFRDAMTFDGKAFSFNMEKSKEIWRNRIRAARKPRLAALDVDLLRALEKGDSVAVVAEKKQALRDAPADPAIESAATPEQLKAVWPECLKG